MPHKNCRIQEILDADWCAVLRIAELDPWLPSSSAPSSAAAGAAASEPANQARPKHRRERARPPRGGAW